MAVFKASSKQIEINQYCLNCHKKINREGNLQELFYCDDVLCQQCRYDFIKFRKVINIGDLKVESLYLYKGLMRELLIQYKEYNDEALFPVFLYKDFYYLNQKYKGYKVALMPSSISTTKARGFNALEEMYSLLKLERIDLFYKNENLDSKTLALKERDKIAQVITRKPLQISNDNILLVDDIVTSGATLNSAYQLIKGQCKTVKAFTLCYNERFLNHFEKVIVDATR